MEQYQHTQSGGLHWILIIASAIFFGFAYFAPPEEQPWIRPLLVAVGGINILLSLCFQAQTVRTTDQDLVVRFGPIPLFGRRIPLAKIEEVEPVRWSLLDGFGIHYVIGRGWTYNLWGFDLVRIRVGRSHVRVGTDDVEGLTGALRARIAG